MVEFDEVAIIFEPYKAEDGSFHYKAVQIVEGSFDEDSERFIDSNLYSYPHLTYCERGKVYGNRVKIKRLKEEFPNEDFEMVKKEFLKENTKYDYFLGLFEDEVFILRKDYKNDEIELLVDEESKESYEFVSSILEEDDDFVFEDEYSTSPKEETEFKVEVNPHQIYSKVRNIVKGQDQAIKEAITTIWENYNSKRANNMILVGPSGVGKTEILRQFAKNLNVPLFITTVAGMSQAGYIGKGTDEILSSLLSYTKGDVTKAEHAIVILDEFDKIAFKNYEDGKVSTEGVQNELLKIVEDGTFDVEFFANGHSSKAFVNTKNITFIGAGAFNGMLTTKINGKLGFGSDITSKEVKKEKILPEDLIKFGLKPELVGRMGKIIRLNELDLPTMKDIIKNSEESVYTSKVNFISERGINVCKENEDEIVEEIAKIAISKGIGARAISSIVTEMFSDILFEISNPDEKYTELEITKETVTDPKKYVLKK